MTPHTLRHYVSFRTMSGIRKGLQISSEISDQVARGFCQLSNIVLPAYGRAIARSVECWGYRCLRNDFRNRPMCAGHKAFCNRSRAICSSTVHRSWLVAPCRLDREVKTMSPVTGEICRENRTKTESTRHSPEGDIVPPMSPTT